MYVGCTDLVEPCIDCPQLFVVVFGAGLDLVELSLKGGLFSLVLAHLA